MQLQRGFTKCICLGTTDVFTSRTDKSSNVRLENNGQRSLTEDIGLIKCDCCALMIDRLKEWKKHGTMDRLNDSLIEEPKTETIQISFKKIIKKFGKWLQLQFSFEINFKVMICSRNVGLLPWHVTMCVLYTTYTPSENHTWTVNLERKRGGPEPF